MERMLELAQVSRASYYRLDGSTKAGPDPDMDLRDAIQRIALERCCYGRRRMVAELRRRGWTVGKKRVARIMREDNLLCALKRKFVVTTDSNHGRKVYPNLAANLMLTGTDQLWRADITSIRLRDEFRLSGGDPGRLLAPGDRMGAGPEHRRRAHSARIENGVIAAGGGAGSGSPL